MRIWHASLFFGVLMGLSIVVYPITILLYLAIAAALYYYSKRPFDDIVGNNSRKYLKPAIILIGAYIIAIPTAFLTTYGLRNYSLTTAMLFSMTGIAVVTIITLKYTSFGKILNTLITPPKNPPEKEEILFYRDDVYKIAPKDDDEYWISSFFDGRTRSITWEELYLYFKNRKLYELV